MEQLTKDKARILFVGDERICRQVAYVLDFQTYELVDKLTTENYPTDAEYQIFVCEFKRKSKDLVCKSLIKQKNIKFLEDICRVIDQAHRVNRVSKKDLRKQCSSWLQYWKLSVRSVIKKIYYYFKGFTTLRAVKRYRYDQVKGKNIKYLRYLKASQLFLYVLRAPVNPHIHCSLLENVVHMCDENVLGCCSGVFPFGSLSEYRSLEDVYHSTYAHIIKLSSLNRSYCLCNTYEWCPHYVAEPKVDLSLKPLRTPKNPLYMTIAFDHTCNLSCKSCRKEFYCMSNCDKKKIEMVDRQLRKSGYLDETKVLTVAGAGEVFYSPYYRKLIESNFKCKNLCVLSNGTLFNQTNWDWLKQHHQNISVKISVDAATKETYQKLRGGDFENLINNLKMIGSLRRQNKIYQFDLNFVVQRDNFREMPDFVRLAKSLGADHIEFQRMNNFGNLTKKEFLQKCLIINDEYLDRELWEVLQDPIFAEPIVDLRIFTRYIEASKQHYNN